MAINKKLIHFKKKENFNSEVANGNILDASIVFIKDAQQIYTHGQYYTCKDWAEDIDNIQTQINTLVSGDASTAIENFNEIISFLEGIEDTESLDSIIASIEQQIANVQSAIPTLLSQLIADSTHRLVTDTEKSAWSGKQDVISDLETIRQGAAKGATALQSYTEKYTGTITGINMNGSSMGTSGVVDLGTVITEHQDISGKQDVIFDLATIRSGAALGATALQTIPSEYITESELEAENYVASSDGTITNILKVTALPNSPDANTLYIIVEG